MVINDIISTYDYSEDQLDSTSMRDEVSPTTFFAFAADYDLGQINNAESFISL